MWGNALPFSYAACSRDERAALLGMMLLPGGLFCMQTRGNMQLVLASSCCVLDHIFFLKLCSAVLLRSLLCRAYAPGSGDEFAALLIIVSG